MFHGVSEVNPVPRTYVRGFGPVPRSCPWRFYPGYLQGAWYGIGALPFGQLQNIHPVRLRSGFGLRSYGVHPRTHVRGVLWYGVNHHREYF